jgi:hypothetical protein
MAPNYSDLESGTDEEEDVESGEEEAPVKAKRRAKAWKVSH